jgi:hypothetical protein
MAALRRVRSVDGMVKGSGWRRLIGVAVAVFGAFVLVGGLFVPIDVILDDPGIVPAPESWVAAWVIVVGLALAVWPGRRR